MHAAVPCCQGKKMQIKEILKENNNNNRVNNKKRKQNTVHFIQTWRAAFKQKRCKQMTPQHQHAQRQAEKSLGKKQKSTNKFNCKKKQKTRGDHSRSFSGDTYEIHLKRCYPAFSRPHRHHHHLHSQPASHLFHSALLSAGQSGQGLHQSGLDLNRGGRSLMHAGQGLCPGRRILSPSGCLKGDGRSLRHGQSQTHGGWSPRLQESGVSHAGWMAAPADVGAPLAPQGVARCWLPWASLHLQEHRHDNLSFS